MIDKLFFVALVLNATGLFRFVAPQVGASIGQVSIALLLFNILYLATRMRLSLAVLLHGRMGGMLLVFVVWPFLTLSYAPAIFAREIGLVLYFFSLFFASVVYTISNGLQAMQRVLLVSLAVSVVGVALSMTMPGYFESVAAIADVGSDKMGRAFGFFMQPNSLATGMGILFIGWYACWRGKKSLLEIPAMLGLLAVILLSGSRTGMLLGAMIVGLIMLHSWKRILTNGRQLAKVLLLALFLATGIVALNNYLSVRAESAVRREGDLFARMETLLSFKLSSDRSIMKDQSIQDRMRAQATYFRLIGESPLFGHGFGSDAYYHETKVVTLSAHSDAIASVLEYGLAYPFVFGLVMLQMYLRRRRRELERALGANSITQFVLIMLFLFTVNGGLLESRTFYVVLGLIFAITYCPQYLFTWDKDSKRITGWKAPQKQSRTSPPRPSGKPASPSQEPPAPPDSSECIITQ